MKNKKITFRVDQTVREDLEKLAKEDSRTLSNYCNKVLIDHIEKDKNSGTL